MTNPPRCRIAYIVSKYPDFSHTFILREVLALRKRGIEIDVASINASPGYEKLTQAERDEADRTFYVKRQGIGGVLVAAIWMLLHHPIGLLRGKWFALVLGRGDPITTVYNLFYFCEALILARWMHQRSLTHIHVHFATPAATVAMILTRSTSVTMSMTVHGPDEFYNAPGYFLADKIKASKFVVCISYFAQSQLMKLSPGSEWGKFDVARLGVDSSSFAARSRKTDPGKLRVLCVGRLVAAKGQRILIQAVAELIRAGRAVELEFVGDGPDRPALEALGAANGLGESIRFVGTINQDNIQAHYKAADIFALASFAEGIPVVLMEAMAMEIPCVSTRIAGIPELIQDGVDGLLVAPSDVQGLAAAIAQLMDDPLLRTSLGEAGRRRVQRQYELAANVEQLSTLLLRRLAP